MVLRGAPGEFQETFPFLYSHPQAPPAPPAFLPWFTHRREESFTFSVPGGGGQLQGMLSVLGLGTGPNLVGARGARAETEAEPETAEPATEICPRQPGASATPTAGMVQTLSGRSHGCRSPEDCHAIPDDWAPLGWGPAWGSVGAGGSRVGAPHLQSRAPGRVAVQTTCC